MVPPAFQTKVLLNTKVSALKPNKSLKAEFGPPGIKFLTEPLIKYVRYFVKNCLLNLSERKFLEI